MERELICISCPIGCRLTCDITDLNDIKVSGNTCPRGAIYAKNEIIAPKRMVTGSVKAKKGMISVKTNQPIDKKLIFESLKSLKGIEIDKKTEIGDVIVKNVCDSGVDFIATRSYQG